MPKQRLAVGGLLLAACQFGSSGGSASAGVGQTHTTDDVASTGDDDGVATAGSVTAASQDTTGASGTGGVDDGPAPTGTSTGASNDETGGSPGVLIDRGLLARYYLDEAVSGDDPPDAFDAAVDPINLTMGYDGGQPMFVNPRRSQTGLRFFTAMAPGSAAADVNDTKLEQPLEATTATIEVVVQIDQASQTPGDLAQLVWIGTSGNDGRLALSAGMVGFRLAYNDSLRTAWDVPMHARQVVTMVVDTGAEVAADRTKLYVDGVLVPGTSGDPPGKDATISIPNQAWIVLGNKLAQSHSFRGVLYYAAVYDVAMPAEDVAHNAMVLAVDDDRP